MFDGSEPADDAPTRWVSKALREAQPDHWRKRFGGF